MSKIKVTSKKSHGFIPYSKLNKSITIQKFLLLYDEFLKDKKLEGLAKRTIEDYQNH